MLATDGASVTLTEYPEGRADHGIFALEFMRRLPREGLTAAERAFLHHVVLAEDAAWYRGPVRFWLAEFANLLGCSVDTVARVRQRLIDAGWLVYIRPEARRQAGSYWVTVPESSNRTDAVKTPPWGRTGAVLSTLNPKTKNKPAAGRGRRAASKPTPPALGHLRGACSPTETQETQSSERQAISRPASQTPTLAPQRPQTTKDDRMTEPDSETPQTASNATTRSETARPFPLLAAAAAEWDELMGENPVPASLAEFQLELLDWARYRKSSLGPNWDPFVLEADLIRAARLGGRLKQAVDWAIRMRKDRLPEPKRDCPLSDERLAIWHRLKLRLDSEGWPGLDDRAKRLLRKVGEAEGIAGKEEFRTNMISDSGWYDLKRAMAFFKLLDEVK